MPLKLNAASRKLIIRYLSNFFPLYIVTEHPKSGGTWVSQMVAEYLRVPFPRNRMPIWGSQVMHTHDIGLEGQKYIFVVLRDGRDVMVSYYYHSLFYNDLYNARHVDRVRQRIQFDDHEDIRANLSRFIDLLNDKGHYPRLTWRDFTEYWLERGDVGFLRYERLLADCMAEMTQAVEKVIGKKVDQDRLAPIIERFSFANQAKRMAGEDVKTSWLRKGIAGDWKNVFSREAAVTFDRLAGETLIRAGYEPDHSWVEGVI